VPALLGSPAAETLHRREVQVLAGQTVGANHSIGEVAP
jgi:hypothetical protein